MLTPLLPVRPADAGGLMVAVPEGFEGDLRFDV